MSVFGGERLDEAAGGKEDVYDVILNEAQSV